MIQVRPFQKDDRKKIEALHSETLPKSELSFDHLLSASAVVVEDGELTHAAILRATAELYYVASAKSTKRENLGRMLILQKSMIPVCRKLGIGEVHGWVPPEMSESVTAHKTMLRMGWQKSLWSCYVLEVA